MAEYARTVNFERSPPRTAKAPDPSIDEIVRTGILKAREKLIDLSLKNTMLSYRHSETSTKHIRLIGETLAALTENLSGERAFDIAPLPPVDVVPPDEDTDAFREALKQAKTTDAEWLAAEDARRAAGNRRRFRDKVAERQLRDRVRQQLGMSEWRQSTDPKVWARELGLDPSYDLPAEARGQSRQRENKLQTLFFPDRLAAKLSSIHGNARTLQEDAGISALFCAVGFLEWYENDSVSDPAYAPLVLLPVNMEKRVINGEYVYSVAGRDDDESINVALREKLKRHHSIELPEYDPEAGIEAFLKLVARAIQNRKRWRIRRWATIGLFSFSRQAMWSDLDPASWPVHAKPEGHALIRQIYGEAPVGEAEALAPVHDVDRPEIEAKAPAIVIEVDASQLSAVIDAAEGKNLVIQGPPGTGKSQTITNIIANAMAKSKSVLFVSEKMAALNVVKNRLDDMGLGLFCLEVHSAKASKMQVLKSLKERMQTRRRRVDGDESKKALDALHAARKRLTEYVTLLNGPAGQTGVTIHDILWGDFTRSELLESVPPSVSEFRFPEPLAIDRFKLADLVSLGRALDNQSAAMDDTAEPSRQPWRGLGNTNLTRFDRASAVSAVGRWSGALRELRQKLEELRRLSGWEGLGCIEDAGRAVAIICSVPSPGERVEENLLPAACDKKVRKSLTTWATTILEAVGHEASVEKVCARDALATAADTIEPMAAQAATLGVAGQDLDMLTSTIAQARQDAVKATANIAIADRVLALAGIDIGAERDAKSEAVLAGFLLLLNRLPLEKLRYRSPHFVEDEVVEELEAAQATAEQAAAAFTDSGLSGEPTSERARSIPDAAELRAAAASFLTAGWVARLFGKDWKRARKLWISLWPEEPKVSSDICARRLKAAALWKEKLAALDAYKEAKDAAGRHWNGALTPFANLLEVARWTQRARQTIPLSGSPLAKLRGVLLSGSADDFAGFAAIADESAAAGFAAAVQSCAGQHRTLGQDATHQQGRVDAVEGLRAGALALRLRPGIPIGSLADAIVFFRKSVQCRQAAAAEAAGSAAARLVSAVSETDLADRVLASVNFANAVIACQLPEAVTAWLLAAGCVARIAALRQQGEDIHAALEREQQAQYAADAIIRLRPDEWCGSEIACAPLDQLVARAEEAAANPEELEKQILLAADEEEAREAGLGPLIEGWRKSDKPYADVALSIEAAFYRSAAEKLIREHPVIAKHTGRNHEQVRQRFRDYDKEMLSLNRKTLAALLLHKPVPAGSNAPSVRDYTDYCMLDHQTGLTRPRIALRRLFSNAGGAIRALKPCVMMSPMSVAQYLEPGKHKFDLLVVDEASQMRPEEALGAMLRCDQAVIVGDPEQLPPSDFFVSAEGEGDQDAEDAPEESILELGRRCWRPMRRLEVHYRSRHQSLIDYSNREFYEEGLLVFPSPILSDPDFGVSCRQVDGAYEPGQGRNPKEARAVVEEAAALMRTRIDRSIGIVAVNKAQSDLIESLIDEISATDPEVQAYRQTWSGKLEDFFVKNLENVQGDERDIILVSTVYGRTADGIFHQNFGPLNKAYGHRRLNVLFTRAKRRLTVFTSLDYAQIVAGGKQRGVRVLKEYLEYATHGTFQAGRRTGQEPENDFERWFLTRLKSAGYEAHPQVGVAKFRIDIGVVHPDKPGSYILGIECDGATYHSSKSARDRDRLRQDILEGLNWRIHRVWSTDWYRDPEREFSRLVQKIESYRAQLL